MHKNKLLGVTTITLLILSISPFIHFYSISPTVSAQENTSSSSSFSSNLESSTDGWLKSVPKNNLDTAENSESDETSTQSTLGEDTQIQDSSANSSENQETTAIKMIKEVSTWDEFKKAVTDQTVTEVKVINNLTATSAGPKILHNINIDFQNRTLDLGKYSIETANSAKVTVSNLLFTGLTNGSLFTGEGEVTLTGNVQSLAGNESGIANAPAGTVIFDDVILSYDREKNKTAAVRSKNFYIINQSIVKSEAIKFYANDASASANSTIIIDNASHVITNSNKNSDDGQVWHLDRTADFYLKGDSTLEMEGDIKNTGETGGLFIINGNNTTLNILEGANFYAHSANSPAVLLQSNGGQFNVSDQSNLKLQSDGQANNRGATLRFRQEGNMSFNVSNHSKIEVEKTAMSAPAIRMAGGNNKINVSGGSDFIVKNAGDGKPTNPGSLAANQGIQYSGGGTNEFNLMDEDSSVFIDAKNGAAIDAGNDNINVSAQNNTYFVSRGNTASDKRGIFNAGNLNFKMEGLKYFDFRNDAGGLIFETSSKAKFSSTQSDLSVWSKTSNLDGDPTYRWDMLDYGLSGANYKTLDYTTNPIMQTQFGTLTDYSRMSANNQEAVIDNLRTPTNADKYIYAHAQVPEAKGEMRDAFTDEVHIKVGVFDESGQKVTEVEGDSMGEPVSVYGDEEQRGLFKIDAPDKGFLKENYTIKVLEAWRGYYNGSWIHQTKPEDIFSEQLKIFDVVPPKTAKENNNRPTISPGTKVLNGTGEVGANVLVSKNGILTDKKTQVDDAGDFSVEMPDNLKKDDIVQVFLQDNSGTAEVIKPPFTNSSVGNIQPEQEFAYHDTEFEPALKLIVAGSLDLISVPEMINFGVKKVSSTKTSYTPTVKGDLIVSDSRGDGKEPWRITLQEDIPLTSDTNNLEGLFYYTNADQTLNIGKEKVVVEERILNEDGEVNISSEWNTSEGISLKVPIEKQISGNYKGKLAWTLEDVPSN